MPGRYQQVTLEQVEKLWELCEDGERWEPSETTDVHLMESAPV